MSARRTSKPVVSPEQPSRGRADLARLRREKDADIRRTSPPDLANLPADFWQSAVLVPPVGKEPVSIRLDVDILAWFRGQGPRYQSRINAVLRAYMEAMGRRPGARRR